MTDTYSPSQPLFGGGGGMGGQGGGMGGQRGGISRQDRELLDYYDDVGNRVTLLTQTSPWLANQPDVLQSLAMNPMYTYDDLAYNSASLAAQANLDGLANQLARMSPGAQRAIASQLTTAQQQGLAQLGYQPPGRESGVRQMLGTALSPLGYAAGGITGALGSAIGPTLGGAMNAMEWAADRPAHLMRANIAQEQQWITLAGALAGGIGIAAAPMTGGLSLMLTAGAISAGALAGATIASAATNPSQWVDSFNNGWDGERVFTSDAQRRAREILGGDEALATLARDVAWEGALVDLAEEFASVRDATSENQMMRSIERVLLRLVAPDDPQFDQFAEAMTRLAVDPTFVQAVNVLQDGKLSFGRWATQAVGINPGDSGYGVLSGAADGLFLVALDPTFGAFGVNKMVKATRYAVDIGTDSAVVSQRIKQLYEERETVRRAFGKIGQAIDEGDYRMLKAYAPNAQSLFMDMRLYRTKRLEALGDVPPGTVYRFDGDEVLSYFVTTQGKVQLLKGRGLRPGAGKVMLPSHNNVSWQWAKTKSWVKAVIDFADANQGAASLVTRGGARAAGEAVDEASPVMRELAEGVADEFNVRRMFKINVTPEERRTLDMFLEMMEEYPLRRDEETFLALLTRTQFAVIKAMKRLGMTDEHTLKLMDAFERPKMLDNVGRGDHLVETRRVLERQVSAEIPPLPAGKISRTDAMPTAQPMTGSFGMEVAPAAVRGTEYQRTRAFVNAIDQLPIVGAVERQMGALFGSFTSMVPRKAVNLDNPLEIDKFVDLGRVMGIPADVRDAWRTMILTQENRAGRIVAVEAYIDTMLRMTGIETLPEGVDLSKRFLVKYHQAYALNGLDELWVNGRPRRVGLLPHNDQAIDLILPNLRELRQAVQRGHVMKYLFGVSEYSLIEKSMTRVWKPSVLMRIGFIPRAAGEELMAHVARTGFSGLLAEWGEVAVYRGRVANDHSKALAHYGVRELDQAMLDEMQRWKVASHLRPLERMFSRFEFGRPAVRIMEEYTKAIRTWAERGLAPDFSQRVPAKFREAMLGDERSFRRLMMAGSDQRVQRAISAYEMHFADNVMKEISSRNAGLHEPLTKDHVVSVMRRNLDGDLVEEQMVRQRNEFRYYSVDDPLAAVALHERINHVVSDPVMANAVGTTLARVVPESVDPVDIGRFAETMLDAGGAELFRGGSSAGHIAREMLGKTVLDHTDLEIIVSNARRMRGTSRMVNNVEVEPLEHVMRLAETGVEPERVVEALLLDRVISNDEARAIRATLGFLDDAPSDSARQWWIYQIEHGTWTNDDLVRGIQQLDTLLPAGTSFTPPVGFDPDLSGYFLTPQQGMSAFKMRSSELLSDPRFNGRVNGSLRAGTINELPVLNPVADNHVRTYFPAVDADVVRGLSQMIDENPALLNQMLGDLPEAGALPMRGQRDVLDEVLDELALRYEMAVESIRRTGGAKAATTVDEARLLFRELIREREYLDELIRTGAREGFEHRVPLTFGGTLDPQSAQALGDAMTYMVRGGEFMPGTTRIAFHDSQEAFSYGWRRKGPADELADNVLAMDSLARIHKTELVPDDLYVNGNLRSSTEDAFEVWADGMVEVFMQVAGRNNTVRVATGEIFTKNSEGVLSPVTRWTDDAAADARQFQLSEKIPYFDANGKSISIRDPRVTKIVRSSVDMVDDEVAWSVIGPAMRDSMDSIKGSMVLRSDGNRQLRSSVRQVAEADPHELPEHVLAAAHIQHEQGAWEKVVNGFFDKVAGPSIDAIVRTPMARHHFINSYLEAEPAWRWLIDTKLLDETIPSRIGPAFTNKLVGRDEVLWRAREIEPTLELGRKVSDDALIDYVLGMSPEQLRRAQLRAHSSTGDIKDMTDSLRKIREWDRPVVAAGLADDPNKELTRHLLDMFDTSLNQPFEAAMKHDRVQAAIANNDGLFRALANGGWEDLREAKRMFAHVDHQVGSFAAERAVLEALPFIDSHQIKSQFGEYTRNLLPFWYAEENFLKRWGKTLALAPQALRKGQLTYMGMQEVGLIRTDPQGRDWFVYPGSQILSEAIGTIPGLEVLPVGAMFQAETSRMLPGFDRVGAPSPSPLISIPLEGVTQIFPEVRNVQRSVVGDIGVNRGIVRQIVPAQLMNLHEAFLNDEHSSRRMASAMMSAAAYMEANGLGLAPDATTGERDDYMRRLRRHARVIVLTQAITAFIVPGAPSQITTGRGPWTFEGLTGINVEDTASLYREEYLTLVRNLGMEEGTAEYLRIHDGDMDSVFSPLAFTVGRSRSTSGAVLPATMEAVSFYESNRDWMADFPNAGPWLLPPDTRIETTPEDYAYTQQTIDGLRNMRTPEDFVTAIKFKEGATPYFEARKTHTDMRAELKGLGEEAQVRRLDQQWSEFSRIFLAQHPIFAEELQGSEGRNRRKRTIDEMRMALRDPLAPQPWHADGLRDMFEIWEEYQLTLRRFANGRDQRTRDAIAQYKFLFENFMEEYTMENPHLAPVWVSLIRPESSLD